jgi:hypothetical protein
LKKKQKTMTLILNPSCMKKEQTIFTLTEGNLSNIDAIAALSDKVLKLTKEIEMLKKSMIAPTSLSPYKSIIAIVMLMFVE